MTKTTRFILIAFISALAIAVIVLLAHGGIDTNRPRHKCELCGGESHCVLVIGDKEHRRCDNHRMKQAEIEKELNK